MRPYSGCYVVGAEVEYTSCYPLSYIDTIYGKYKLKKGDVIKINEVRYIDTEGGRYILFKIKDMDNYFENEDDNWFNSAAFRLTDQAKAWKLIKKRNDKIDELLNGK